VKRTGRGKTIGAVTHIGMRTTQRNFLCSYLYLKLAKMLYFSIISHVFSSTKWENKRGEQFLLGSGGGRGVVQIRYAHASKCKNYKIKLKK
jgi:hypothetical protein